MLQVFWGCIGKPAYSFILRHPKYAGSSALSQVDRNHSSIQPHKKPGLQDTCSTLPPLPKGETVNWVTSLHRTEPRWALHHYGFSGVDASCSCSPLLSVARMHQNYTDSINIASSKTETSSLGNLVKSWNVGCTLLSPARDYKPGQKRSQVPHVPHVWPQYHMWVLQHLNWFLEFS